MQLYEIADALKQPDSKRSVHAAMFAGAYGASGARLLKPLLEFAEVASTHSDEKLLAYTSAIASTGRILQALGEPDCETELRNETTVVEIEFALRQLQALSNASDERVAHVAIYALGLAGRLANSLLPHLFGLARKHRENQLLLLRLVQAVTWIDEPSTTRLQRDVSPHWPNQDQLREWLDRPKSDH